MSESTDVVLSDETAPEALEEENTIPTTKLVHMKKAATLAYAGYTGTEIAEELGFSPSTIAKWLKSQFCMDLLAKFNNSDREFVKDKLRKVLPAMCDELIKDITCNSDNKYRAIDKIFKVFDFQGKTQTSDQLSAYKELVGTLFDDDDDDDDEAVTVTVTAEPS